MTQMKWQRQRPGKTKRIFFFLSPRRRILADHPDLCYVPSAESRNTETRQVFELHNIRALSQIKQYAIQNLCMIFQIDTPVIGYRFESWSSLPQESLSSSTASFHKFSSESVATSQRNHYTRALSPHTDQGQVRSIHHCALTFDGPLFFCSPWAVFDV